MRALVINDETRTKVAEVVEFAAKNWYRPGRSETIPGDDPRHVVMLNTFRCVFSYTVSPSEEVWRHLSVSVPSKKLPNPFAFYTIAELFGFTGWNGRSVVPPSSWTVGVNKEDHCIVAVQRVES